MSCLPGGRSLHIDSSALSPPGTVEAIGVPFTEFAAATNKSVMAKIMHTVNANTPTNYADRPFVRSVAVRVATITITRRADSVTEK